MKVLHITNTLEEGGVESLLMQLLPRMSECHIQVEILVLNKSKCRLAPLLEQQGIKVHIGKYASTYNPLNIFLIRKYISRYDIVHVHLFPSQYYAAVAQLLTRKSIVAVTTEHGNVNTRRQHSFFRPIEKAIYSRYKVITSVSPSAATALSRWLGTDRVIIVTNGIDLQRLATEASETIRIRRNLGIPRESKVLIMAARFYEAKDHATLIRSMTLLPSSTHLILAGSGPTLTTCIQLSNELGVADRIHFIGYTDRVSQYIKASDIGILSSHHEAFGMSLVEYMACGIPAIASDIPGIREVASSAALLFRPSDSVSLSDQILTLVEDPALYHQYRQKGIERAQQYDIRAVAEQYIAIYERSLCKKS